LQLYYIVEKYSFPSLLIDAEESRLNRRIIWPIIKITIHWLGINNVLTISFCLFVHFTTGHSWKCGFPYLSFVEEQLEIFFFKNNWSIFYLTLLSGQSLPPLSLDYICCSESILFVGSVILCFSCLIGMFSFPDFRNSNKLKTVSISWRYAITLKSYH